jgi:hypothetical protein
MSGLKLGRPVVDSLCQLAGTLTLSGLILGGTGIGNVSKTLLLPPIHFIASLLFVLACLHHVLRHYSAGRGHKSNRTIAQRD